MPENRLDHLLGEIGDEIYDPKYDGYEQPIDYEIDKLLNNICADLKLSLRFCSTAKLVRVDCDDLLVESEWFQEVAARFKEEYHFLVHGPNGVEEVEYDD